MFSDDTAINIIHVSLHVFLTFVFAALCLQHYPRGMVSQRSRNVNHCRVCWDPIRPKQRGQRVVWEGGNAKDGTGMLE